MDWKERILSSYLGPRLILLLLAAVYATNFPLGAVMNAHLPASAATTARMVLAAAALAPFVRQLSPELRLSAVLCGCFTAAGYVTQSLALQDTDPARVSFLGSVTVLWCPLLELLIEKKPMAWHQAPQVWLAAILCLAGVGVLELSSSGDAASATGAAGASAAALALEWHAGDLLALLQAVGFGTGVFWTSRMLSKRPDQALPVTATLLATTSFLAMIWSLVDGWVFAAPENLQTMALPGLLFGADPVVAAAVVWTGLISTSLNFYIELTALGRVNPSEASVLLASEPLWAALFAAAFLGASLSQADAIGGALIVSACLVNAVVTPEMLGMNKQHPQEARGNDRDGTADDDVNADAVIAKVVKNE